MCKYKPMEVGGSATWHHRGKFMLSDNNRRSKGNNCQKGVSHSWGENIRHVTSRIASLNQ